MMEIPKNTTQIGEVHGNYRVFIEDYVISYMKQLCRQEPDRKKRIALYGVKRTEEPQQYFFIYGGSEVERYGKNDRYLTKQDYEEITWKGESYFEGYVPLGFVTIEDELPDGIFLFDTGKELYVEGYHIFYEKNEGMLTFLIHRQSEMREQNQEQNEGKKLEQSREQKEEQKQEQKLEPKPADRKEKGTLRRQMTEVEVPREEVKLFGIIKSLAAALFIVLCVIAVSTMNGLGKMENVQNYFQQAFQMMKEKKIPDKEEAVPTTAQVVEESVQEAEKPETVDTDAVLQEADMQKEMVSENTVAAEKVPAKEGTVEEVPAEETVAAEDVAAENPAVPEEVVTEEVSVEEQEPRNHTIQAGETLISISKMYYGDDSMVQTICQLNGIVNSDNIQVGQKIILP